MELKISQKYNIPAPRYTSYPTVPYWKNNMDWEQWKAQVKKVFSKSNDSKGISIYIHLPFCESLCTYCGCTKHITCNHGVESEYIEAVLKEWKLYSGLFDSKPIIKELHLGGGTPTFFSPENLKKLLEGIFQNSIIHPEREFSFEGHPNNTSREHLNALFELGFRRVSFGIQDLSLTVQKTINRVQPIEKVKNAVAHARDIGYESINFDLVYGLPHQSIMSLINTMDQVLNLLPDRIAFYSYAHMPSLFPAQRSFENFLPNEMQKMDLYLFGKNMLQGAGYTDIGMDHFCLPNEDLAKAKKTGSLHRNFMGYTTQSTDLMIGLGASAISDSGNAFFQNTKNIREYQGQFEKEDLESLLAQRSHLLSEEELYLKSLILDIACKGKASWTKDFFHLLPSSRKTYLNELVQDGLITMTETSLELTSFGKGFLRLVCAAFDQNLPLETILDHRFENGFQTGFSKAI